MNRVLLLLVFCVLSVISRAQVPAENSLLWEISGRGLAKPSYLFGTIHLICPTDFSLSDSLKSTLSRTQQVALEMDMDDPGMMAGMMKTMNMTAGNELKKLVTAQEYERLEPFLQRFGACGPGHVRAREAVCADGAAV